jgi:hypothetical protein
MAARFVVDAMLGSLARWLRLLGYDTLYFRDVDDLALAERARRERRVLVTRDRALAGRRDVRQNAVLIRARRLRSQWIELARACGLRPAASRFLSRCGDCNAALVPLPRARARGRVPPYVHATRRRFRSCPACGRVFWRATHRSGISARLAAWSAAAAALRAPRPLRAEAGGRARAGARRTALSRTVGARERRARRSP